MAFIRYADEEVGPQDRVPDQDNILRIHGVNPRVIRQHYDLYVELMRRPGPLSREQREMVAVMVSAINGCHY